MRKSLAFLLACAALTAAEGLSWAQTTRFNHASVLLPNGNIVTIGGSSLSSDDAGFTLAMSTVEIFSGWGDPPTTGANMAVARASHTATLLPDGRILVVGGCTGLNCGAIRADAELYNPVANAWTAAANQMPEGHQSHTATLLPNGTVLIAGGQDSANTVSAKCYIFNPADNTFTATGNLNQARTAHSATLLYNGKVFVAGGFFFQAGPPPIDFAVTTELYSNGAWSPGPTLIWKRAFHTATAMGNRNVFISGGLATNDALSAPKESLGFLETTEIYNPSSDSISPGAPMQERKMLHASALISDGGIRVIGGLGNVTTSYFNTVPIFGSGSSLVSFPDNFAAGVVLGTGIINSALTTLAVPVQPNLTVAANGTIVDGDIFFSSPTAQLEDAKVFFTHSPPKQTRAPLNGVSVVGGLVNPSRANLALVNPTGMILFNPREATSEDIIMVAASSLTYNGGVALPPGQTRSLDNGTLFGKINISFPTSDMNGLIINGSATVVSGSILRANNDTVPGFVASLNGGAATLTECYPTSAPPYVPDPRITSDGRGEAHLNCYLRVTGITGAITNSSSTAIAYNTPAPCNPPPGPPPVCTGLDMANIILYGLTLNMRYAVSPVNLQNAAFNFDIATVTIRRMVFNDVELYDPSRNAWAFVNVTTMPAFGKSFVLAPNRDELLFGGVTCTKAGDLCRFLALQSAYPSAFIPYVAIGGWDAAADLNTARSHHASVVLPSGRVATFGGTDGTAVLNTTEIYDPGTQAIEASGPMILPRNLHTATLLSDGTVLAAGGFSTLSSTGATSSAEIFYPEPGAWVPTSPMSSSRSYHTAALLPNGNVLVYGGYDALGNMLSSAEIFIATAAAWRLLCRPGIDCGVIPSARAQHTMTLLQNGDVLVAGGVNTSGVLSSVETYNYRTGVWTSKTPMSTCTPARPDCTGRYGHSATLLPNGRVLVAGGDNGTGEIGNAEIYDPKTNTWTRTRENGNDMLIPRLRHNATLLPDGKVIISGGVSALGEAIDWAEGFDLMFSSWQAQGQMTNKRGYHSTVLMHDGTLASIGGFNGLDRITSIETRYFGEDIDSLTPGGTQRQPQGVDVDTGTLTRGGSLSVRGARLKGVSEASGGRGSANSGFHHPRLYFYRMDASGNNTQASSGFSLDASTRYYYSGSNLWANVDSSITFTVPESTGLLPVGWYQLRTAANAQFSTAKAIQVGPMRPAGRPGVPWAQQSGVSSVTWTWAAAPDVPGSRPFVDFDGYHVYSDTNGVFIATVSASTTTSNCSTAGEKCIHWVQRSLGPDALARIRVAPYNLSGDGQVNISTTGIRNVSGVTSGLSAPQSGRTQVSLKWQWDTNAATYYWVYSSTSLAPIAKANGNAFILTGLSTNTAYAVAVQAVMDAGSGPMTAYATAYTLADAPAAGVPPMTDPSTGSILAQWFQQTNPSWTNYDLLVVREDGQADTYDGIQATQYGVTKEDFIKPNTRYFMWVFAVNGDNMITLGIPMGSTFTYVTKPEPLSVPYSDPSNITVSWSANGNPSSTTYKVVYSSDTRIDFGQKCDVAVSTTHISPEARFTGLSTQIPNLLTGKNYTICVSAINHYGYQMATVSTSVYTDNGGGPEGSLRIVAQAGQTTSKTGNIGSGRTVTVNIPAGTFDDSVTLFIASETLAECGNINAAINVIPYPYADPRRSFEIGISYVAGEANLGNLSTLGIVRYDPTSRACVPLKSRVDTSRKLVIAEVNHLSIFKLMSIPPAASIDSVRVYPNPFFTHSQGHFTFDGGLSNGLPTGMPAGTRVRIYTLHGELVFDGAANASGMLTWDARNKAGRPVGSGIYLAVIQSEGAKKIMKVVVLR
ncbi:MAG: fibronectin type III domain-containing protein [Elusimicrobia bacterium]|nr:fibronectin type III domain-containing protein [Elusimicrobiota bacterium]